MDIVVIHRGNHQRCLWLKWKQKLNKHLSIWIIRSSVTHIKSSIFEFNRNIPNKTLLIRNIVWSITTTHNKVTIRDGPQLLPICFLRKTLKKCFYWVKLFLRRPVTTINIFPSSESLIDVVFIWYNFYSDIYDQLHVFINGNYFGIIL